MRYIAPRFWPMWIFLCLLRVIVVLPLPALHAIGRFLGRLLLRLSASRRRVSEINLRQAYPDADNARIDRLCRQTFESGGISMLEMALAWWAPRDRLRSLCHVSGFEHVEQAQRDGRPILFLTGHFTALDLGGIMLALHVPIQAVYKRAKDPLFNEVMDRYRNRHLVRALPNTEIHSVIKELKKGLATWYAPDQDFSGKDIVYTPFLGGMASTLTSTARMTRMAGAVVIPFYPRRLEDSRGYELVIMPPLDDFPGGDTLQDAAAVNRCIESMVHANPEQYAWFHRRFKNQPDGQASLYSKR